jgi:hypothetical protein
MRVFEDVKNTPIRTDSLFSLRACLRHDCGPVRRRCPLIGEHSCIGAASKDSKRTKGRHYTCHNSLLLESIAVKLEESTALSGLTPLRFAPLPRPLSSSRAAPEAASAVVLSAVPPYCGLTVGLLQLNGCSSKLAVIVADTSGS